MLKSNNSLSIIQSDRPNIFKVKLNLATETRLIGVLDTSGDGTFHAVRNEKHIYRATNSIGMNYELLKADHIKFKWIVIHLLGKVLVSSRQYFLKNGRFMRFSRRGFELQLFVPIEELNLDLARALEEAIAKKADPEEEAPSLFGREAI